MASGHVNRILQAEHMAAPTSGVTWRFSLTARSRPHMALSRPSPAGRLETETIGFVLCRS